MFFGLKYIYKISSGDKMKTTKSEYSKMVKRVSPKSPHLKNFIFAFLIGGIVCTIGQLIGEGYKALEFGKNQTAMLVPVTLIFIAVVLTALKVFDNIAKHAGAGTLVPITGFANAVASPAIEYKTEGFVLGVGANMFKIAGPVIVYGTVASVVYGVIYWIMTLF